MAISSQALSLIGLSGGPPATKRPRTELEIPSPSFDEVFSDDEDQLGGGGGRGGKGGPGGKKVSSQAKKNQHCEVEKRRRERMNRYMTELAQMIPACTAVPRRLDKLSILKMAVDHMKNLRGDPHSSSDYKPGFLTDEELKKLVVEAANGFMMIINCSQARILFVSDTIHDVLKENPDQWIGSCFYDLLHPKDIQSAKEQLSSFNMDDENVASLKQSVSKSPLVMHNQSLNGLRRSFLCRVKKTSPSPEDSTKDVDRMKDYSRSEDVIRLLQSAHKSTSQLYSVLHCTGFIRNLTSSERQAMKVDDSVVGPCLVTVARLQNFGVPAPKTVMPATDNEFVSRVSVDGRITYVDPRVSGVLGYLPQDLIGQTSYEYYHPDDIQKMVQLHHEAMKRRTPMPTVHYRFLSRNQKWVWLAMKAFSFINPFSQVVEYVVCTNVVLSSPEQKSFSFNEEGDSTVAIGVGVGEGGGAVGSSDGGGGGGGGRLCASPDGTTASSIGSAVPDQSKQDRIQQFVRMTISQRAEQQVISQQQQLQQQQQQQQVHVRQQQPNPHHHHHQQQGGGGGGPLPGRVPQGGYSNLNLNSNPNPNPSSNSGPQHHTQQRHMQQQQLLLQQQQQQQNQPLALPPMGGSNIGGGGGGGGGESPFSSFLPDMLDMGGPSSPTAFLKSFLTQNTLPPSSSSPSSSSPPPPPPPPHPSHHHQHQQQPSTSSLAGMQMGGAMGGAGHTHHHHQHQEQQGMQSNGAMGPSTTTLQENAEVAHRIVSHFNEVHAPPPPGQPKDMNYGFPKGLFNTEVNLKESQPAYQALLHGLDNPQDFHQMFLQVDADPFRTSNNIFGDFDFELFD